MDEIVKALGVLLLDARAVQTASIAEHFAENGEPPIATLKSALLRDHLVHRLRSGHDLVTLDERWSEFGCIEVEGHETGTVYRLISASAAARQVLAEPALFATGAALDERPTILVRYEFDKDAVGLVAAPAVREVPHQGPWLLLDNWSNLITVESAAPTTFDQADDEDWGFGAGDQAKEGDQ